MDFPWKKPTNLGDPPLKPLFFVVSRFSSPSASPSRRLIHRNHAISIRISLMDPMVGNWQRIGEEDWKWLKWPPETNRGSKTVVMFCVMLFEGMILSPQIAFPSIWYGKTADKCVGLAGVWLGIWVVTPALFHWNPMWDPCHIIFSANLTIDTNPKG